MDYSIFGPLSVRAAPDEPAIDLADKPALLLARLLVEPGTAIAARTLAADVWGPRVTTLKDPDNSVQRVVAQLRQRLGDDTEPRRTILLSGTSSYRLIAEPTAIDTERFKLLARRGRSLLRRHPKAACAMLTDALASWRGDPLDEYSDKPWIAAFQAELDAVRDAAEVDLNEALLTLGEHVRLEGDLHRQIAERPTDERRRAQLLRVLEAMKREAEANIAYRAAVKALGTPGTELRSLGDRIASGKADEQPAAERSRGVRSDPVLLHAVSQQRAGNGGRPGPGLAALLVVTNEGEPQTVERGEIVATFDTGEAAVGAAKALAANAHLRCAVALHTGPYVRCGERLIGAAPSRCRLLAGSADPGQVLVSAAARERYWPAADFRDLGERRYEDLLAAEHVFEVWGDAPGVEPARQETLDGRPHNLPVFGTRFVGRERELARLAQMVGPGRLVTLLGSGGGGKTRLGLQLAARSIGGFDDGCWFAGLAELPAGAGADAIAVAILAQLGVRPIPEHSAGDNLIRHLSDHSALLVVDNCEHLLDGVRELIADLRAGCPQLCIVATSRHPLRIDGEMPVAVPPMTVQLGSDRDSLPEAVELLLERAGSLPEASADTGEVLADAVRICAALDGSPLAIELAAGHIANRGMAGVAVEVDAMLRGERDLGLLSSRDPSRADRQRDIETAIRWSHALMSPDERLVLRRLALFGGTFGMAEAQQVAADDRVGPARVAELVGSLVDWSMVAAEPPLADSARLRLKQAIRAFALAELEQSGEVDRVRARHADVYRVLATSLAPGLFGPGEQDGIARLEADHDNFRLALTHLVGAGCSSEALEMVGALWWLWFSHGHFQEGSEWVDRVLALDDEPSHARVRALRAGSHLTWWRGDYPQTDAYNRAIEDCAEAVGDDWGRAWAPMGHGAVVMFSDPVAALPLFESSREQFDAIGRPWEAGYALQLIAISLWFTGQEDESLKAYEECVRIYERIGHGSVLASVRRGAGMLAARRGRRVRGRALCKRAFEFSESIGDRQGAAQALNFLGAICSDEGELARAAKNYAGALSRAREVGDVWATCSALDGVAGVACRYGEHILAARLLACSDMLAARAGYERPPHERARREAEDETLRAELPPRELELASAEGEVMAVSDALASSLAFVRRAA